MKLASIILFIIISFCTFAQELPEKIFFNSDTTAIGLKHFYALVDGQIYRKERKDNADWELFGPYGIPFDSETKQPFSNMPEIKKIMADDNVVMAVDSNNRVYSYECMKGFHWFNDWGGIGRDKIYIPTKHRAYAFSRRSLNNVKYFNDSEGNVIRGGIELKDAFTGEDTKFGTMHIYVLSEDGTEINYADPGLMPSFGYRFPTPKRSRFVSTNIAAAGNTIFLIGENGEMYTRMIDFESSGNNPMLFHYTYKKIKKEQRYQDMSSHYGLINLPAEPWRKQPSIPLTEQAIITKNITIITNGEGNSARELRVMGTNSQGVVGYYYKNIYEQSWKFEEQTELAFKDTDILNDEAKTPLAPSKNIYYSGELKVLEIEKDQRHREERKETLNLEVELLDFNLVDSPSSLVIHFNKNEKAKILLHTVDTWTMTLPNDPGRDGTGKLLLGTLELKGNRAEDFKSKAAKKFFKIAKRFNLKGFAFDIEATKDHITVKGRISGKWINMSLTNTKSTKAANLHHYSSVLSLINQKEYLLEEINNPNKERESLIEETIQNNMSLLSYLNNMLDYYSKNSLQQTSLTFITNPFAILSTFTGIRFLDAIENIPPMQTIVDHGVPLIQQNANSLRSLVKNINGAIKTVEDRIEYLSKRENRSTRTKLYNYLNKLATTPLTLKKSHVRYQGSPKITLDLQPLAYGYEHFYLHVGSIKMLATFSNLEEELNKNSTTHKIIIRQYLDAAPKAEAEKINHQTIFSNQLEIKAELINSSRELKLYDKNNFLDAKRRINIRWSK